MRTCIIKYIPLRPTSSDSLCMLYMYFGADHNNLLVILVVHQCYFKIPTAVLSEEIYLCRCMCYICWVCECEYGFLTSHSTIFQSYTCMWRHIDVQADWRRSWTYGRAPVLTPTRDPPFYAYSEKPPHFSRLLRHAWGYGGHILDLNTRVPTGVLHLLDETHVL